MPTKYISHVHFFLQTLANPLRLKIIETLRQTDLCVSELVDKLNEEQSKVSHALSDLLKCHIVEVRQSGKSRIYSLNEDNILQILALADKHVKEYCKEHPENPHPVGEHRTK